MLSTYMLYIYIYKLITVLPIQQVMRWPAFDFFKKTPK